VCFPLLLLDATQVTLGFFAFAKHTFPTFPPRPSFWSF
jgi:hypothetical protein